MAVIASWADDVEREELLAAARQEDEEHWRRDDDVYLARRNITRNISPPPLLTSRENTDAESDADSEEDSESGDDSFLDHEPRRADPWLSLGQLFWGTGHQTPVSYTHLTLPTKRIV